MITTRTTPLSPIWLSKRTLSKRIILHSPEIMAVESAETRPTITPRKRSSRDSSYVRVLSTSKKRKSKPGKPAIEPKKEFLFYFYL